MRTRQLVFGLLLLGATGCVSSRREYYPYRYPWYYDNYGTYTVVRRPVVIVDGWTTRAFRYRPYRGFVVRRHNSSPINFSASKGNETLEVNLTGMGDSTRVEVKAKRGDAADKERARKLMGDILKDYK